MKHCCMICPNPAAEDSSLCGPCTVELAHRILAAEPEPEHKRCSVCEGKYSYTEARVLRSVKSPGRGDAETPRLCWVCARLHHAAVITLDRAERKGLHIED